MAGREYRLSILVTGRDAGATGLLGRLSGGIGGLGKTIGGVLGAALLYKLGQGILNVGRNAIEATGQIQAMRVGLEGLVARELKQTGQVEDMGAALKAAQPLAAGLMDELARISILSPYQLTSVQNTFRQAMAFGFATTEAKKFTEATLNMAAGVGADNGMLSRMAYNLAQVRLQGRVTRMDIRQLAMAGFDLVDVLKYVGKEMGVVIEDHLDFNKAIEEGKITWEDFTNLYAKYADENFGGASERMSRTLMGLKSTFADVFQLSMPAILGPAVEKITRFANVILDKFLGLREKGVFEAMGEGLANAPFFKVLGTMTEALEMGLTPLAAIRYTILETFGKPSLDMFDKFRDKITEIFDDIKKNDWGSLFQFGGEGFVGLTEMFKQGMDAIDWAELSTTIAEGIDSVDWVLLGDNFGIGLSNIIDGISIMFQETDWYAIIATPILSASEFLAGTLGELFGVTVPGSIEEAMQIWIENSAQLQEIMIGMTNTMSTYIISALENLRASTIGKWEQIRQGWTLQIINIGAMILTNASRWVMNLGVNIDGMLQRMENAAVVFYGKASNWVSQAALGVLATISQLVNAIQEMISQAKAAVTAILIPVEFSFANFKMPKFGGGGGGGGCFVGDTLISMSDGTKKKISQVEVGDFVVSLHVEKMFHVHAEIVQVFDHDPNDAPILLNINNDALILTPEHIVYCWNLNEWIAAKRLRIGDILLNKNNLPLIIGSINQRQNTEHVYNLHTDHDTHNYYANDLLVHNAKGEGAQHGGVFRGPMSGYPGPIMHGSEAIIPLRGGAVPVQLMGGGAGGGVLNITIHLQYQPMIGASDELEVKNRLVPYIIETIREEIRNKRSEG